MIVFSVLLNFMSVLRYECVASTFLLKSRTPLTRTTKGDEKQFELAVVRVLAVWELNFKYSVTRNKVSYHQTFYQQWLWFLHNSDLVYLHKHPQLLASPRRARKRMCIARSLKADLHGTIFAYDCRMRFL